MESLIINSMVIIALLLTALFLYFAAIGIVDLFEEQPVIAFYSLLLAEYR